MSIDREILIYAGYQISKEAYEFCVNNTKFEDFVIIQDSWRAETNYFFGKTLMRIDEDSGAIDWDSVLLTKQIIDEVQTAYNDCKQFLGEFAQTPFKKWLIYCIS